jgi:hypothetical protein
VNAIDAVHLRDGDDLGNVQVRPNRLSRLADQVGFVGLEAMQSVAVFVGIDGHGTDAKLVGAAEDPDGDFTAIGDEQLGDLVHDSRGGSDLDEVANNTIGQR